MKKILVVDDEANIREVVSRLLKTCGFDVTVAQDASEALDIISNQMQDMVITDVKMPGEFSGIDLLKIIKAGFDIPVIVMSGYGSMELVLEAMQYGASEFVSKPLDLPHFASMVKAKLNGTASVSKKFSLSDLSFATEFKLDNELGVLNLLQKFVIDSSVQFGLEEIRASSLWLSVNEALKNAMTHGNAMQNDKKVCFLLSNMPREISVNIEDEGNGFDVSNPADSHDREEHHHMRGLELIDSLADDVQFNEKGNGIKIVFLK